MGQGLHTKIIQVASRALNLPTSLIHIRDTDTNVVPNATLTGGSHSTDYFGGAVKVKTKP
jgi:xanthine dehydrogenase/oxidase